jgi:RNA polymerase sigma-70 factor, ECF subfamily
MEEFAMARNLSFENLKARLRAGDKEAASQVFHLYANRLILLAQRNLEPQLRAKFDPEDVIQSVFRSFFRRNAAGQMEDLETWESLWKMLVVITLRKCGARIDFYHAASRDIQREVSLSVSSSKSDKDWEPLAPEPTPDEAAILTETVAGLISQFEGRNRQILTHLLQGYSIPEIISTIGCTERTVYRLLQRVKMLLETADQENLS